MANKKAKTVKSATRSANNKHNAAEDRYSSDGMTIAWCFDKIDRNGKFAFNTNREDFDSSEFLSKLISYGTMTCASVKTQTHDKSAKSKHHFLSLDGLSPEAQSRVITLIDDEDTDSIFSFAFTNVVRIIGVRENEKFHVIWYDPKHEFCPSTR